MTREKNEEKSLKLYMIGDRILVAKGLINKYTKTP